MNFSFRLNAFVISVALCVTLVGWAEPASTQEAGFKPGELAPALSVQEWVKGDPISKFEPGKVYLVEFWALWCGPCIGNIPHLNALQRRYAKDGLVVIGFTSPDLETGEVGPRPERNPLSKVREFVASRGDRMDYHVAYDTADRATYKRWMHTLSGIPQAFLIDRQGRLAASDHPYFLDEAIQEVLDGTWDISTGANRLRKSTGLYSAVTEAETPEKFWPKYDELALADPLLARKIAVVKLPFALRRGDTADIEATVTSIIDEARAGRDGNELGRLVIEYLRPRGEFQPQAVPPNASATTRKRVEAYNQSALKRVQAQKLIPPLPLSLAERAAQAAYAISSENANALGAMAEVARAQGNFAAAVDFERRAVANASAGEEERERQRLAEFEQALKKS